MSFEEIEHTADRAFRVQGRNFAEPGGWDNRACGRSGSRRESGVDDKLGTGIQYLVLTIASCFLACAGSLAQQSQSGTVPYAPSSSAAPTQTAPQGSKPVSAHPAMPCHHASCSTGRRTTSKLIGTSLCG